MYKLMTPGPTQVAENVRMARSLPCTNPDLDETFVSFYQETCELISRLLCTEDETLILDGEGILGLEAACASLTEPGDKVLVLDNGVYGRGFADFVTMYGGKPEILHSDELEAFSIEALAAHLEKNSDYAYATLVHCDTPSGVLNDIHALCPLLKQYGILTIVDSVSSMFGEEVQAGAAGIDILCGASQKAVSAPPGLSFVTVSADAKRKIKNRRTPIASFYANLSIFEEYACQKWFPYTMPISDIYGLRAALDDIATDKERLDRHAKIAGATREALTGAGLRLHLKSGYSNTVSVFDVPPQTTADAILSAMRQGHGILLSGSFGALAGKVIRIGHMGTNANLADMTATMCALSDVLTSLGVPLTGDLGVLFLSHLRSFPRA